MNQRSDRHREQIDAADMMQVILRCGITWWGEGGGCSAPGQEGTADRVDDETAGQVRSDENHGP
jgi:hypothetical protein